jgi:hypothetical protein
LDGAIFIGPLAAISLWRNPHMLNGAFMKNPIELSRDQLVHIVRLIQEILYMDPHTGQFDCDREWSAADVCQEVAELLERYDLLPISTSDVRE